MKDGSLLPHDWFPRSIPESVHVGHGAWLYSAYSLLHAASEQMPAVVVGAHSGVYDGCHFELGPAGRVTIGEWASVVGAIINTNRHVRIGDYAFIAHEVVIADDAMAVPPDAIPPGDLRAATADPAADDDGVQIGANAWIGARAILLGRIRVGANAIIGAGAIVTTDVPPDAIAAGNPARVVGRVPHPREP